MIEDINNKIIENLNTTQDNITENIIEQFSNIQESFFDNYFGLGEDCLPTHYKFVDKYWSVKDACFVDTLPDDGIVIERYGNNDGTLENLIDTLKFYKYPLGELTPKEDLEQEIRSIRNKKLSDSDYLVMPDYPLSEDKKQKVLEYRQSLRDIPTQENFPYNIIWPVLNI